MRKSVLQVSVPNRTFLPRLISLLLFAVLTGCGGGNSGDAGSSAILAKLGPGEFVATDFTFQDTQPYIVNAAKVAEGVHCYVYLEQGKTVTQAKINAIVKEFDETIYPGVTAAFGSEPNPGVDNDPKVHVLLLDIRDGYNGTSQASYVAGYFDPGNEYATGTYPYSNEKEMLYMDISPSVPASPRFFDTLAHELQHMVHWEQKDNRYGITDETWLDEGMSEIAPAYCGYGPNYGRVRTFEITPSDSLTRWDGYVSDYAVAYMWAYYMKDRFSGGSTSIFWNILQNGRTGIESVNAALGQAASPATFTSVFKDWTIANYSGNSITWPSHPEWSYTSVDTRPGNYNGITLPGLFPASARNPTSPLPALDMWSSGYTSYTPLSQPTGTLIWNAPGSAENAALADLSPAITSSLLSGQAYTFTTTAYLIRANAGDTRSVTGASVTRSSIESGNPAPATLYPEKEVRAKTPKTLLDQAGASQRLRPAGTDAAPEPVCVHSFFAEKSKGLRAKGAKSRF